MDLMHGPQILINIHLEGSLICSIVSCVPRPNLPGIGFGQTPIPKLCHCAKIFKFEYFISLKENTNSVIKILCI